MTDDIGEFRAEVGTALAGTSPAEGVASPESHPTLDELIAYREDQLAEPEADRLQEHLVSCRECFDRLTELEGFVEAGVHGPPEVASLEEASAWRALQGRRTTRYRTVPLTLAASFLVAAIGLGLWAVQQRGEAVQLREQLAALSQPQPDTRIVDLFSDAQVRSGLEKPSPVDPGTLDHLTVILHLPEPPDLAAYEAAIADPEGRELWRGPLRMDEDGALTLGIPGAFLAAGTYRIALYGVAGDSRQLLETFPLELVSTAE